MTTKRHLYDPLHDQQLGLCACCGEALHEDRYANHIDRISEGGEYTLGNCQLLRRECHMRQHGIEPGTAHTELRMAFRNYRRWQAGRCSLDLELRGAWTSPYTSDITLRELERQTDAAAAQEAFFAKEITRLLKESTEPIVQALMAVKGTGPITTAMLVSRVDIKKAEYASSLWKFFGLAGPSAERYTDGEKGGGSKEDRAILRQWAETQVKLRTPYRQIYDSRREKTVGGDWKSDAHRYADACRLMVKLFLAHTWVTWRELEGLPTPAPYAMNHLNHHGYISPEAMGWGAQEPASERTTGHAKRAAPREEPVAPQRPDYHPQRPHETPPL